MTEELKQLREALRRVKYEAASLADAQVIALEALTAAQPAQAERDAFEPVLIDGVAYDVQAPVAAELLRLHIELQALPTQPAQAGEVDAKCQTCNGHGLVGGHMQDGSGYAEGCPDCNPEPAPLVKWARAQQATPVETEPVGEPVGHIEHTVGGSIEHGAKKAAWALPQGVRFDLYTHPAPGVPDGEPKLTQEELLEVAKHAWLMARTADSLQFYRTLLSAAAQAKGGGHD